MNIIDIINARDDDATERHTRSGNSDEEFTSATVVRRLNPQERMDERFRCLEAAKRHLRRVTEVKDPTDIDANWHMSIVNVCAAAERPKEDGLHPIPEEVANVFPARHDIVHRLRRTVVHETASGHVDPDSGEKVVTEIMYAYEPVTDHGVTPKFPTSIFPSQMTIGLMSSVITKLEAHIRERKGPDSELPT